MEDYKKKYEDALKRAKSKIKNNKDHVLYEDDIIEIFPELKESEDEKIRKAIIDFFSEPGRKEYILNGFSVDDIIAWLEKQGEQNTNEIHPIFRVGDYIKNKKTSDKVLIEQLDIATKAYCYVSYDGGAEIHSDFSFSEQDEWMLIGQNIVEQNPTWSKEDENILNDCIKCVEEGSKSSAQNQGIIDWLKSLKERYTWKPSDEQMELIKDIVFKDRQKITRKELAIFHSIYNDLKKLKS